MQFRFGLAISIFLAAAMWSQSFAQATRPEQYFKEGFDKLTEGNLQDAAAKFESGLAGDPTSALALFYLGEAYFGLKQNEKARSAYERALSLDVAKRVGKPEADWAAIARDRIGALAIESNIAAPINSGRSLALAPRKPSEQQPGSEFKDCDLCPTMVVVPAGQFVMGASGTEVGPSSAGYREPPHIVTIARSFAVGKFEVTFAEWEACVRDGGGCEVVQDEGWGRGKRPVININRQMVERYLSWLKRQTGKSYRLLSEAEWEYSARAGSQSADYWDGNTSRACQFANVYDRVSARQIPRSWEKIFDCDDGFSTTAPVGTFKPNAFGLYDMLGNVYEMVSDCFVDNYVGVPSDGSPFLKAQCENFAVRGLSWQSGSGIFRIAARADFQGMAINESLGLRVAVSLP